MTGNTDQRKRHADAARDARLRLRAWLWNNSAPSTGLRVAECGRKRVAQLVSIRSNGQGSGLGGVSTCGSVWACPMCSAKVAQQRSDEVASAMRAWRARGGAVLLVTLTLRHTRSDKLADTWDALGHGWAAVRNGSGWKADSRDYGIGGYCRVVEVTHGRRNGWHPHAHVLMFVRGDITTDECETLRGRLYGRWSGYLAEHGYSTMDFDPKTGKAVGVDVRIAAAHGDLYLAEYLSKFGYAPKGDAEGGSTAWGIAREVARGDLKTGRKGSRTPWELLEDASEGSKRARALWHVWERASKGRRQYSWAKGFLDSLDLDELRTDAEVAEAEDAAMAPVAFLPAEVWTGLVADLRRKINRPGTPLLSRLMTSAATLDPEAFRVWLTDHGLRHFSPAEIDHTGSPIPVTEPVAAPSRGGVFDRSEVSWNLRDHVRREAVLSVPSDRPVEHPCRVCAVELAPQYRDGARRQLVDRETGEIFDALGTGVHPACSVDGYRADRLADFLA